MLSESPNALISDSYLDLPSLRRTFAQLCDLYRNDPVTGLPAWVNASEPLLSRPIVCPGSQHGIAHQTLAFIEKYGCLKGIVDDFRTGTTQGRHLYMSMSELVVLKRTTPDLLLVNTAMTEAGRSFINRFALQHNIQVLDTLQFYRALRIVDQVNEGILTRVSPIGFFDKTLAFQRDFERLEYHFSDSFSLITMYNLLIFRLTFDLIRLTRVSVGYNMEKILPNTYILSARFFNLGSDEVFVDCGAYRGDTMALFSQAVQNKFKHIYAFEPDPVNFAYCQARALELFGKQYAERVSCHAKGVWDDSGRLSFCSSDLASHFIPAMDYNPAYAKESEHMYSVANTLEVVALDDVLEHDMTLFKLEVEGSEVPALCGARKSILRSHPKMSLSVYHRPLDLIQILDFVENLDLGYTMSMLHHNVDYSGTVCYYNPQK